MSFFQYIFWSMNLLLILISIGLWLIVPEQTALNISCTSTCFFLTLVLMLKNYKQIFRVYKSDFRKFATTNIISIFLLFCIIALINLVVYKNPKQIDFTKRNLNSISEKSVKVVEQFKEEITFNIFADKANSVYYTALLELYRFHYKKIKINIIEPLLRPDLVSKYQVNQNNTAVIEYQGRKSYITESSEKAITNSLLKLIRVKSPVVLITQNHGELNLKGNQQRDISLFVEKAKQGTLNVKSGSINDWEGTIKFDKKEQKLKSPLDLIISINPKYDFTESEISFLERHVQSGGHLLFALGAKVDKDSTSLKNLNNFLKKHGFIINNNIVLDRLAPALHKTTPLVLPVESFLKGHRVFTNVKNYLYFPFSRSISVNKDYKGKNKLHSLAHSSNFPASWGESSFEDLVAGKKFNAKFESDKDFKGPLSLLMTSELKTPKGSSRISILGSSLIFSNAYINLGDNLSMLMNLLSWKLNEEIIKFAALNVTGSEPIIISLPHQMLVLFSSVIVIPLMLLIMSFYFYRRNSR
jgi:hypothetical protein